MEEMARSQTASLQRCTQHLRRPSPALWSFWEPRLLKPEVGRGKVTFEYLATKEGLAVVGGLRLLPWWMRKLTRRS